VDTVAATELVESLESIAQISEESSRDLAESRERGERVRAIFEQRLKEKLAGESGPSSALKDVLATASPGQDIRPRMALREACFLNAFNALMRLYADPESRSVAEKVFGLLREERMIGFAEELSLSPADVPRMIPDTEEQDPEARKRALLNAALKGQSEMRSFMQKRQALYDTQIERSQALLQDALATAKTLLN
jgi:hypothetical protein